VLLVIVLGYPAEKIVIEEVGHDQEYATGVRRYRRHHVPKPSLTDIIIPVSTPFV
jgi:hypothetical protein